MASSCAEKYVNNCSESQLVDAETGELITLIGAGDKVKITRKESIDSFMKLKADTVELNKGRNFVKQFPDISERLCSSLNANEIWLFNFLIPYVGTNSGVLKLKNGRIMARSDLVDMVSASISRAVVDRSLNGLYNKGIIAKCSVQGDKCYVMNPYVCQRGSRANATLLTLFSNTEWAKEVKPDGR